MTDTQIRTLLKKGYSPEHIANYGQCSRVQVDRVITQLAKPAPDWKITVLDPAYRY